ncbi:MAG: hypothetical protein NE330_12165 [Lentisphaeraceae bacterium]|nr:hypothetical protein [Lentisphaeraceae bacterium]
MIDLTKNDIKYVIDALKHYSTEYLQSDDEDDIDDIFTCKELISQFSEEYTKMRNELIEKAEKL